MDLSRYKGLFLSEAAEHLRLLDRGLVALERDASDRSVLEEVFRSAHSVKGMAGAMQYRDIQAIAHAMEDLLEPMRRRGALAPGATDVLLSAVDAIRAIVSAIEEDRPSEVDWAAVVDRLARFAPEHAAAAPPPRPAPAPPTAPRRPSLRVPTPEVGKRDYLVQVEVSPSCTTPAVRAFIVYRKMAGLGDVVACEPSVDALKAGDFQRELRLVLRSVAEPDAVEQVLSSIPDLSAYSVQSPGGTAESGAVLEAAEIEPPPAVPPHVAPRPPTPLETRRPATTVRVRTELLDRFMDSVGDLLMARARLQESARRLGSRELEDDVVLLDRVVRDVHDRVLEVRLVPVSHLTERLPRVVRDLAVRGDKRVKLEIEGGGVELDRAVVEALDTPLLHLARNAVDHGIEPPEERVSAGKTPEGHVRISARRERDEVTIEVADDGRGIDPARLREAAVRRGLLSAERAAALDDRASLQLIFLPGLSTAAEVSEVSGRGVGMDVVKTAVESLGGSLEVSSEPGVGTRIAMRLPLTVAVLNVLVVLADGTPYAFPVTKVERTVLATESTLREIGAGPCYVSDGMGPARVLSLARLLGLGGDERVRPPAPMLLFAVEGGMVAIAVDGILGQREVVLRPLGKLLERIEGISGVGLLSDGRPVFVLDAVRLCRGIRVAVGEEPA